MGISLDLSPAEVIHDWALWQVFSWVVVATNPFGILFSALILFSIGRMLEEAHGSRMLLQYAFAPMLLAGVLTLVVSLVIPSVQLYRFAGASGMAGVVWVVYGLWLGHSQVNFWGVPVTGNVFAAIGIGFVLLNGLFASWLGVLPELVAIGLGVAFLRFGNPLDAYARFQSWRLRRRLKGRSKNLRLISPDRNMPSDSDRYLH